MGPMLPDVVLKEGRQKVIYSPTLNSSYDDLQGAIDHVLSKGIVIVAGDCNARPSVAAMAIRASPAQEVLVHGSL